MTEYITYVFNCKCPSRVLFKNLKPYCAWCREPLVEAANIAYADEHFVKWCQPIEVASGISSPTIRCKRCRKEMGLKEERICTIE